ncbi:uncharacterized protein LOC142319631 [Lycorma delicatula]|uniref:uncharacterized protein LOC142319631 n=1 Tax=Lycorma delicatula TaxID=130591 RepID=UPI003F516722
MMPWKRPGNVPYPNVWLRFEGRVLIDGKPLKYRIQDVTDDLIEPVIEHMCRYFIIRENLLSHDGMAEDEVSLKELRKLWRETLERKMTLVALLDEDDENSKKQIVGCNVLSVSQKGEPKLECSGRSFKRLFTVLEDFYGKEDLYEKYGVDKYLSAYGLSVSPQFQGDSVGYHLLKARDFLCQATGLTVAVTLFSNPAAIHSAIKAGYTVTQDTTCDKYEIDGKIFFPRLKSRLILSAKRIPEP